MPLLDIFLNPDRKDEMLKLKNETINRLNNMFKDIDFSSEKSKEFMLTLLYFTSKPCKYLLKQCQWKGQEIPCEQLFKIIPTDVGFCCSFNHISLTKMMRISRFAQTIKGKISSNLG